MPRPTKTAKIAITITVCVLVLGVAAAFAGPVIYRDLIAEPPAEAPTLQADDRTLGSDDAGALDPAELSGTWTVADGSEAGYRVDEVLNGTDVTVTGRTSQVEGRAEIDGLTLQEAEFTVDVASIATDNASRDDYFRGQALRTDEHPTARFVLSEPVTLASAPVSGEQGAQKLSGKLTLAGVTRSAVFPAQFSTDGRTVQIVGSIPIVFADFGVQAPDLGFVKVEPEGEVEVDLTLAQQ